MDVTFDSLVARSERVSHLLSPYGYYPTTYVSIIFLVLFGVSTLGHTIQAGVLRTWWMFPTACLAGALEVLGWSGRLWSSYTPRSSDAFQIQICATILGPTPLVAANFIVLGRIIARLGPAYSRLSPKWYTIIFLSCDIIALVVQGIGGGMAAVAVNNEEDPSRGGNVMLGGIIFQMVAIALYAICAVEFYTRYVKDRPVRVIPQSPETSRGHFDKRLKIMSAALGFSTLFLFIRAVYRTIELADGWTGRIITTEVYFNVLDGMMVVLAMYTVNIAHPGFLLFQKSSAIDDEKSSDA